jgi:hypothetical protein
MTNEMKIIIALFVFVFGYALWANLTLKEEISIYKEALQECKDEPIVDKIIDKIRKEREK